MKIAVIGGSGFVGTRLTELLLSEKKDVYIYDKQTSQTYPELVTIGNVLDLSSLTSALKGADTVVLLAAEHRDDVTPTSLYYDVNVDGMRNTLAAMEANGIKRLVFTSSVAVYGLNKVNPNEQHPADPFNHYGKSKWQAEQVLQEWYKTHSDMNISILRPTVIFGERNRGNVYNLLNQIASGKFMMIGKGDNVKSMAYVGNVVAFINFLLDTQKTGYEVYNYIDKPDLSMNELVPIVSQTLNKHISPLHIPYLIGMCGGYCFDILAWITRKKLTISSVRVKKFCAVTQFDSSKAMASGYKPPFTLKEGLARTLKYEFLNQ
ncbi:MAG: NAD-dependent epimerase/dehydratase family protein [Paludibacteraceae bacterium]|nr:NAD-dependent epimerase/dehydratase family protein [Paludibacteraceae bacterium]